MAKKYNLEQPKDQAKMEKHKSVEEYLDAQTEWRKLLDGLREILLSTELEETLKWSIPTYTINKKNVIGMAAFKEHTAIWFFNGVFLQDEKKLLINAQMDKTKGLRQWRFKSMDEIDATLVKAYIEEAITNQKEGRELKPVRKKAIVIPTILQDALIKDSQLKTYFELFSESKKREFTEYIEEAKREETKRKRLEKVTPMILNKVGLHDKYRS